VGVREREVVVRCSRGWGTEDLMGAVPASASGGAEATAKPVVNSATIRSTALEQPSPKNQNQNRDSPSSHSQLKKKRGQDSPFWKTRVLPAVKREYVTQKTGYAMMGRDWDLDFDLMTKVTKLVDKGTCKEGDFAAPLVLAYDAGGTEAWVCWRVEESATFSVPVAAVVDIEEPTSSAPATSSSTNVTPTTKNQNGNINPSSPSSSTPSPRLPRLDPQEKDPRKIMQHFEHRLAAMGKEELFYRWVELMQYESDAPGGFTPERREEAKRRVRTLFAAYGVVYERFVEEVVGLGL